MLGSFGFLHGLCRAFDCGLLCRLSLILGGELLLDLGRDCGHVHLIGVGGVSEHPARIIGGLGGVKDLSRDPHRVNLELNEWKSLPPGSYRLRVVSHRVTISTEKAETGSGTVSLPLESNEVEFQVIRADPAWQAGQLAAAQGTLDSPAPTGEDAKHAARILRFLGSESATRELARRFWTGNDQPFGWDLKFGLFGSPYRATAIEAMKAAFKDPQHPITQEFVQTLALLEIQSDVKYHDEALNKLIADHMSDLAAVLPGKAGQARAIAVNELLQSDVALNPAVKAQFRQMLLASWDSLPVRRQNELVLYRWDQIGGPELLPVLRRVVAGDPDRGQQMDKPDRASALRRIYEVAPGEGRELILREIANPAGDIGIDVLGLLPERELPQVEQLVARVKTGNGNEVDYQLLERYAGERVLPDIKTVFEAHLGKWACAPQNAMLRYFLRVSPEYGVAQVGDALGQRKVTGCYTFQLTGLKEDIRRPMLEQIAIGALGDPSPEVARNAAEALQRYGSRKAEAALWKRLEEFHEKWKGRTDELRYRPGANSDLMAEIGLEQVLVQAIANGQAWIATEDTIRRLKVLASPQTKSQLDGALQEIQRGEYGFHMGWWPGGTLDYNVGRYSGNGMAALKEKLAQLPSGTHLNMVTTVAERDRHRAEFDQIRDAAAANGLVLQVQTPR